MYVINGSDGWCLVAVRLIVGVRYLERPLREVLLYIIVRTSFRKCTPFLNSEYNFQFYRRVISNLQQYRVRWNPRAQRCSVY